MIDLELISQELARYKEAKEKATLGEWEVDNWDVTVGLATDFHPLCVVTSRNNKNDSRFITLAKNTTLETYCEQLIEEIIALRAKI